MPEHNHNCISDTLKPQFDEHMFSFSRVFRLKQGILLLNYANDREFGPWADIRMHILNSQCFGSKHFMLRYQFPLNNLTKMKFCDALGDRIDLNLLRNWYSVIGFELQGILHEISTFVNVLKLEIFQKLRRIWGERWYITKLRSKACLRISKSLNL